MSLNVIKEYLVKIGASVDTKSFENVTRMITKFSKNLTLNMAALIAAITAATAAFTDQMAKSDLATQKLAISLFTTVKNARSLQTVMDAMGLKDINDLKYVNLIPEQRKQFLELRDLSKSLEPGADTLEGLKRIREVQYQFQKLQVIFSYFLINIAGSLAKLLSGPISKIITGLTNFSKKFQKNISVWADYTAAILSTVMKIGNIIAKMTMMGSKLFELIPFANKIPTLLKLIIDVTIFVTNRIDKLMDRLLALDIRKGVQEWTKAISNTTESITKKVSRKVTELTATVAKTFNIPVQKTQAVSKQPVSVANPRDISTGLDLSRFDGGKDRFNRLFSHAKNKDTLGYLIAVARKEGLRITSTTGGTHNTGSMHGSGKAIDFDDTKVSDSMIARLKRVYGLKIRDERERPKGQKVWGGHHFHASVTPERAAKFASQLGMTAQAKGSTTANITINVNGAKDPHTTAQVVSTKLQNTLNARNQRGIYV